MHFQGLGQSLISIVKTGRTEVELGSKAEFDGSPSAAFQAAAWFMTSIDLACHTLSKADDLRGAVPIASSLYPQVELPKTELSKTEWISFQTARPEDFRAQPSLAVHIDLCLMNQSATPLGAPLKENFDAWPSA